MSGVPIVTKHSDLVRLLDTVVKNERLVRGQSTEVVTQQYDYSKLSVEEIETLMALTEKAALDK